MRNKSLCIVGTILLLTGCATSGYQPSAPVIDRISAEELTRIMPKPIATLSLEDVVRLTKEGNSADQIIDQIKVSNSLYDLTPSQSVALSAQGVDNKVLDYMHTSHELALRNNLAEEINKRERNKREELEKLKKQMWQQQRYYDSYSNFGFHGFHPYGYGAFGSSLGPYYGIGAGYARPWGYW